ncbi:hypothetical protein BDE02_11G011400 [Populus trichocarpa]|nr:hypothetical protein BDE02_11G011400 [Populus trichocarpa]
MAAGKYQESYSSRFSNCKYQVFLSFRGEDTRKNFTDHLYKALRTTGSIVFPLFYDVLPSEVRNQTGSFAAAFVEQEKRFKEEMERVNGWRIALKEVADLAGMVLGDG